MSDIVEMKAYKERRALADLLKQPQYISVPIASIEKIRDGIDELLQGVRDEPTKV